MSLSATSPCTSPHIATLPNSFSLTFDRNEFIVARNWCERFAPSATGEYFALLSLHENSRTWSFFEANVMGYYVTVEPSPVRGVVAVSRDLLALIPEVTREEDGDVTVVFDLLAGVYRLQAAGASIEIDMPRHWEYDRRFGVTDPVDLTVNTADVLAMGATLMVFPVVPTDPDISLRPPFINYDVADGTITAQRSWTHMGGPNLSVSLPYLGNYSGSFSSYAGVVARELYYVDTYCGETMTMSFSTSGTPALCMSGDRCGFIAILCDQYVHDFRQAVIEHLPNDNSELQIINGNEWDSFIDVEYQSQLVRLALVPSSTKKVAEFVRVSTVVTDDAPWNMELAEEINSWNGAWVNTKLVRADSHLSVVSDVFIDNVESLPGIMSDVVEKSRKVKDFISIFQ